MDSNEYFAELRRHFDLAYAVASDARSKGYDPKNVVEIKPAPDIASRVEGIMAIDGLAQMINEAAQGRSRQELAFQMVREICTGKRFESKTIEERLTIGTRVGLAILTEGIVVAPTEGIQGIEIHKTTDGSDYIAILYAGPIRGAGGTGAAMSVALADYGRKLLGIGAYKPQQSEIERYIEEMQIYHSRIARLQYYPPESDIRTILENCPVCVDGLPTEKLEVNIHRNIKRLDKNGKEQIITNKIRGGIGLVLCEGIAQKAKSVLKHTKANDLDWNWLNNIIKVDKGQTPKEDAKEKLNMVFLQELVAGRPVLSYPGRNGSFRLRYGRSRLTGIAAKGFSPATMLILGEFIACGTQLRIEKPGKGCVAAPVDTIEGPFVKLDDGEALRINDIETARNLKSRIVKIISVGDILVTYGDFKKSNTPLQPTSYVEEYWEAQLKKNGYSGKVPSELSFKEAFDISAKYNVPMHPLYIYDYTDITARELNELSKTIQSSESESSSESIFDLKTIELQKESNSISIVDVLERLCIPHKEGNSSIIISNDHAQSLLCSIGLVDSNKLNKDKKIIHDENMSALDAVNISAPFKIMKRATRIGGRIGRPEKAKERLMKPAPSVLFPVAEYGGKERSIFKAYNNEKKKFNNTGIMIDIVKYRCIAGKELVYLPYCSKHDSFAKMERVCTSCGRTTIEPICLDCGGKAFASELRPVNLQQVIDNSLKGLDILSISKNLKGVKGLWSRDKVPEAIEKGILRANYNVHIFKDGTSRFDATDMPMTHFYPSESMVKIEKLISLGYDKDYFGNKLENNDQLLELKHQDLVINRNGAEHLVNVAKFIDALLVKFYKLEPFYNIGNIDDLVGHYVITLSPHT
ncbi:MAG: DNA polymerase II large subunit, partial [Candidatus Micrarchaeaceae archaeon]